MEISFNEFLELKSKGRKIFIKNGQHVFVNFNCVKCSVNVKIRYKSLARRKVYVEPICTICCDKANPSVSYANAEFRKNISYNENLSKGVKKHREENPEVLKIISGKLKKIWSSAERRQSQRIRSLTLWENPEYRQKVISRSHREIKLEYNGIKCESVAEYAFIKYMEKKCDKIERYDVIIPYIYEGKTKNYIPDFKITVGKEIIIYEIKGVFKKRLKEKENLKFKRGFLNKKFIDAKFSALKKHCAVNNYKCRLLLLDDTQFNKIYKQTLKEFKEHENNKERNNLL